MAPATYNFQRNHHLPLRNNRESPSNIISSWFWERELAALLTLVGVTNSYALLYHVANASIQLYHHNVLANKPELKFSTKQKMTTHSLPVTHDRASGMLSLQYQPRQGYSPQRRLDCLSSQHPQYQKLLTRTSMVRTNIPFWRNPY